MTMNKFKKNRLTSFALVVVMAAASFLGNTTVCLADTQVDSLSIERVSVASDGTEGNLISSTCDISGDGQNITFSSGADNLTANDLNGSADVFLFVRQGAETTLISADSSGWQGNDNADAPNISDDGRYIAFASASTNLVPDDTNGSADIFVRDLQTGITNRISVSSGGEQVNGHNWMGDISSDGGIVVYTSSASNLVPGDTNGCKDIFLYSTFAGTTRRICGWSGMQGNADSENPSISADGRYVVFESDASNLVAGDTNGIRDIFLYDSAMDQTLRVSVDSAGTQANNVSSAPRVSGNGRYVVFYSAATNLVPTDTNGYTDFFIRDMQTGVTTLVSIASDGTQGNMDSLYGDISSDGRYAVFESISSNLIPGGTHLGRLHIYLHDFLNGKTVLISKAEDGTQGDGDSYMPRISGNGSCIAFYSYAANFTSNDTNNWCDVFVCTLGEISTPDDTSHSSSNGSRKRTIVTDKTKITVKPSFNRVDGIARAVLTAETLDHAYGFAQPDTDGVMTVQIGMPKTEGANDYEVILPAEFLTSEDGNRAIAVETELATIILPSDMLPEDESAKTISLTVGSREKDSLPETVREQIGSRPIVELNLKVDGEQIYWQNAAAPVTVSIPYTPTEEELSNPDHITVWYIDSEGDAVPVTSGSYDPKAGIVTFTVTHFSQYAVVYVQNEIRDLKNVQWAEKQIRALAAKGIIKGTSDYKFSPQNNITRGDYIALLIRTMGLSSDFHTSFADVKPSDYYYEEIGIARALGIAAGSSDNRFRPGDFISRQDMMVLTERALAITGRLKPIDVTDNLSRFEDRNQISAYAEKSIRGLVQGGLIEGSGTEINPRGYLTRAEAAVILYRIYHK